MAFRRWSVVLFLATTALIVFTFRDYGVTWDESFHVRYGDGVVDFIASGFSDRDAYDYLDLKYYGAGFDLLCAAAARVSPLELYDTRHLLNALVALVGVIGCWFLARELGSTRTAFVAALMLMLIPRWWGHGFNNPKDIPFAAGYVWSVYFLVRLVPVLPRVPNRLAAFLGLAIGLTLAIRVGGLLLFGYLGLVMLAALPRTVDDFKSLAFGGAKIVAVAWLVMLAFWPWAQTRPLSAPFEALDVMSNFTWRGTVLFAGSDVHATAIPASYLPRWLAITLPEFVLLGLVLALAFALREGKRFGLVWFATVFPLVYIMVQRPVIYDGMRHVLFIVPLIACLVARAFELTYEALTSWRPWAGRAALGLAGIYGVFLIVTMARLHPHQYVYFNSFVGGLPGAYGQYETDYWGNSNKEAVGLLVAHIESETGSPPPYRVFVCGYPPTATTFFPNYLSRTREESEADFLVGITRWDCHRSMDGERVAVVERLGTPLSFVLDRRHLVEPRRRF